MCSRLSAHSAAQCSHTVWSCGWLYAPVMDAHSLGRSHLLASFSVVSRCCMLPTEILKGNTWLGCITTLWPREHLGWIVVAPALASKGIPSEPLACSAHRGLHACLPLV